MRWKGRRKSVNVEDRRRAAPKAAVGGGVGVIVLVLIVWALGGNPQTVLQNLPTGSSPPAGTGAAGPSDPVEDERAEMVAVVLADTEEVWTRLFEQEGMRYQEPKLILFRGQVRSACGMASAATGPFYCPGDSNVYIDLSFYEDLTNRFGAPGDFAQAYVVAHEVGHHVQNLLGVSREVQSMRGRVSQAEYNRLSVRLELQADFYAGVWAHHAERNWQVLEPGDIEEALRCAAAIGDDRIQMQSRGHVVPDSFTHGSSEQRMRWFQRGLESGDMMAGDTFAVHESDL